jgi:dihydrofolate reductase
MQHFKNTTFNKTIVMGKKTYESIGRILPNRTNIILSKEPNFYVANAIIYHDPIKIINDYKDIDLYVIGGKSIYELFYPYADKLIVSLIKKKYNCNVFMECVNLSDFKLIKTTTHNDFDVLEYERK